MDQDDTHKEVGLGPGDIVLNGDPAPPPQRGRAAPQLSAYVSTTTTTVLGEVGSVIYVL